MRAPVTLTPDEQEALIPAIGNEIDTWADADCGEHTDKNNAWVEKLRALLKRLEDA